jgi:hypothetical protein
VVLGFVVLGVLVWWLRGALETAPVAPVTPVAVPRASAPAAPVAPVARPAVTALPLPEVHEVREPPDLRGHDAVDPCTAGWEPAIPAGFDKVTALGITVAWSPLDAAAASPYDIAPRPTAVAYLVNGLLDEAATLTGTARRERLTVIVYASQAEYFARTGAPRWSSGLYDGGAVRMPVTLTAELGVAAATLRHELMHAQLHAAVGCIPAWFNEGVAMYFAGAPPVREWMQMLRGHEPFDLAALQGPSLAEMTSDNARRAYAESLAMVMLLVEQTGEPGLRTALQTLEGLKRESPRAGLELWDRLVPGTGHGTVIDALARKVFGVPTGGELDAILRGPMCCAGLRAVSELSCRAGPPPPEGAGREGWIDERSESRGRGPTGSAGGEGARPLWIDRIGPRRVACRASW